MKAEFMYKDVRGGDEKLMVVGENLIIACDDYTLRPSQSDEKKAVINCYVYTEEGGARVRTGMVILGEGDAFVDHVNEREFLGFGGVCE